jgi:hypothetical protein
LDNRINKGMNTMTERVNYIIFCDLHIVSQYLTRAIFIQKHFSHSEEVSVRFFKRQIVWPTSTPRVTGMNWKPSHHCNRLINFVRQKVEPPPADE